MLLDPSLACFFSQQLLLVLLVTNTKYVHCSDLQAESKVGPTESVVLTPTSWSVSGIPDETQACSPHEVDTPTTLFNESLPVFAPTEFLQCHLLPTMIPGHLRPQLLLLSKNKQDMSGPF